MARIRVKRIESLIREEAAGFILNELNDPRLGFITVTKVECTSDLSQATIYVSVLGTDAQRRTSMRGLRDAGKLVRSRIAKVLGIRRVPEIQFILDDAVDKGIEMSELIREARSGDPDQHAEQDPEAPDLTAEDVSDNQDEPSTASE